MAGPYRKSFDDPDERVEIAGMVEDVVEVGDFTVGRIVQPPGWRWSEHIKPLVGGEWCSTRHVGLIVSGRMRIEFKDGASVEVGPNDVFDIPPGHDAWVVGEESVVEIDWSGLESWTGRARLHERVLASLLMTDIVGSTTEASRTGDAQWRQRLAAYFEAMRSKLDRFGGREIDTTGDGIFALFDGASRALSCAVAMREAASERGLETRIGVHVGEIELTAQGARGIAVHEVARITATAAAGEILVSEATYALSDGSGLTFADRGMHTLKGIDAPRRLYSFS